MKSSVIALAFVTVLLSALSLLPMANDLAFAQAGVQAKRKTGTIVGVVTAKGDTKNMNNAWVQIRADGEENTEGRKFAPASDPKAGGPRRDVLAAIRAVPIGTRVRAEWIDAGDGRDLTSFQVLKANP